MVYALVPSRIEQPNINVINDVIRAI